MQSFPKSISTRVMLGANKTSRLSFRIVKFMPLNQIALVMEQ